MGRKKKPFIDKKRAQTFSLVPRSQKDPLHDDPEEAQYVLKQHQQQDDTSAPPPSLKDEDRLTEQQKYGIFFDDGYDYLQHMKEPGAMVMVPGERDTLQPTEAKKPLLPEELFGSEVKVQGHDKKVLPISGPQPSWDPDIVAALEAAETSNTVDDELEDDFVTMANGGEMGVPVYVTKELLDVDDSDLDGSPWWAGRGDFSHPRLRRTNDDSDKSDLGEEDRGDASSGGIDWKGSGRRRPAQFTEYSMTSSIVPRSEALTLLDDRFEQFMVGYEDSQLGAPEEEEEEEQEVEQSPANVRSGGRREGGAMERSDYDKLLLESAVEEFEKNFADQLQESDDDDDDDSGGSAGESDAYEVPDLVPVTPASDSSRLSGPAEPAERLADVSQEEEEEGEEESDGEDRVLLQVDERPQEQWDCESILSTYSNLYNHPTKIVEPRDPLKKQIKLSRKTGIPLGAVRGPVPKSLLDQQPNRVSTTRPREETKEEKRARKQAIKEERKVRRAEKKATRIAFRNEELKLERTLVSRLSTAAVV